MSFTGTASDQRTFGAMPRVNAWNTVASFATYPEAQSAVDQLAAGGFPVGYLEIVGSDLQSVERVTGPMTTRRALTAGVTAGASWGLLMGLLVGLFSTGGAWFGLALGGLIIGAIWGAAMGAGARRMSRGRHNFASTQTIVASRYDLIASEGMARRASDALAGQRAA